MNFYKLGMFEALEKFAIKMTASDLPPFSGMLDPAIERRMNQETLDLYRRMTPEARQKLNPMEKMQVGNLSADPRFANVSGAAQKPTGNLLAPSIRPPRVAAPAPIQLPKLPRG